jgi:formylglycine-generating enzyme required for sulfatase activity
MRPLKSIAGFVFRRGLDTAATVLPVAGVAAVWTSQAVVKHFLSHGSELTRALEFAHHAAWGALAFSLGDDSALDLLRSGSNKHLREQMREFLQKVPPGEHPQAAHPDFRRNCLEQLRAAQRAGLLDGGGIDMEELCRHVGTFAEIGNSAKILDAERAALAALIAEFSPGQYPHLRKLLELTPDNGAPFLITAAEYFFKGEVSENEVLDRVVKYDLLIAIFREQREGHAQIIAKLDELTKAQTQQAALQRRELRPQDGDSIQDEGGRRMTRVLLKQFRELPGELQNQLPDLLGDLGRLAFAAGEFKESRLASSEAARHATVPSARAAEHHNAFLASLQDRDWTSALQCLRQAAELDPHRFMPFPFDDYRPNGILGAGGFGVAFLCDHQLLGSQVVVKTLHAGQLGRDVKELFREANILETVNHDGIVRVRHAAFADAERTRPYLVMDWFDGPSLDDHVREHGPLSLEQAMEMGRQLAEALAAAHKCGVLHRDVKPRNVLIRLAGGRVRVKLIDFGLALQESAARTLTSGNTLLGSSQAGTLDYGPPEQLGKLPGVKVGPWSDVYSWAKTFCFVLFGTPTPRPRQFQSLPQALQDLLDDSLADGRDDLQKRPATMNALLERLAASAVGAAGTEATVAVVSGSGSEPPHLAPTPKTVVVASTMSVAAAPMRQTAIPHAAPLPPKMPAAIARAANSARPLPANNKPPTVPREIVNSIGAKLVRIEPGTFMMGSAASEEAGGRQHKVTLTRAFYMQTTPVTQAQWARAMGPNLSHFRGETLPVEQVTWMDAVEFCKRLSQMEGKKYHLPTEAQWEYACRAGTTTRYNTGDSEAALAEAGWYSANSGNQTRPVGTKSPNKWGIFDMHGNVWEWCHDVHGEYPAAAVTDPTGPEQKPSASRVLRGGAWYIEAASCRSACRICNTPDIRYNVVGFRVVMDGP